MIDISHLTFGYDVNKMIWQDLNIQLPTSCTLLGDNGTGKTTLLKLMSRIIHPQTGEIKFKNQKKYTSSVFLDSQFLFDDISVSTHLEWIRLDQKYNQEQYLSILSRYHLENYLSRKVSELSSGERQWVAIAMIMSFTADLYLLDEPFRHLDLKHRDMLCECLENELHHKFIIMTAHEHIHGLRMDEMTIPHGETP